jgi:broad specificity phosphatase PhoE
MVAVRIVRGVGPWLALLGALALVGCGDDARPTSDARLIEALQRGGLVLVLRHTATDTRAGEREFMRSCSLQRNLSQLGRRQARDIGDAMEALGVPIGDVHASPMCRARDTARLAFRRVTLDRDLVSPGVTGTVADDERRARALRRMAQTPPAGRTDTVLVTHTGNIGGAFGLSVQEGELLVFRPRPAAVKPVLVARVRADEWARITRGNA